MNFKSLTIMLQIYNQIENFQTPTVCCAVCLGPQIREQMPGPDLHVFTLNFLALKKLVFPP